MTSIAPSKALALAVAMLSAAPAAADEAASRGAYVFRAANCRSCHTAPQGVALAGGRALKTPFGIFHSSNITPDAETGIGRWSEADFRRALRDGVSPGGDHYFPVFPYTSFTGMSDADIADLWAYLRTIPATRAPNRPHQVTPPYGWRFPLFAWKWLNFERGPLVDDPKRDPAWNRGRYLVQALGHCGECHTPRDGLGAPLSDKFMAGAQEGAEGKPAPNITPDKATGIGNWSKGDLTFFLETGFTPEGDVVGGLMGEIIENSTKHLSKDDRNAMAEYLLSLPPVHNKIQRSKAAGQ